ncbi:TPM domain-containing protein [candidate division WOR-3 bacterium]|nr:TPM domain-containing protein [candidate division WOR-3 bacterium]
MKRLTPILFAFLLILSGCWKKKPPADFKFPEHRGYVNDFAYVMSPEREFKTEALCQLIERKTDVEIAVVSVPTIEPFESARDYATALGNEWGVGKKETSDGIVILAAMQESEIFLARGEGYEESFDKVLDSIYANVMRPLFEQEDYEQGLYRGTLACGEVVAGMKGIVLDEYGDLEEAEEPEPEEPK